MRNIKNLLLLSMVLLFAMNSFAQAPDENQTIIDAIGTDSTTITNAATTSCPCRSSYNYSQNEIDLFNLINAHRQSIGLSTLLLTNHISNNCLDHNNYMIANNVANHDNFDARADNIICALNAYRVGEVVAYNYSTPSSTLNGWLNSPGHKAIIETPTFTNFGGSVRVNALGKPYYTVMFSTNSVGACSSIPGTIPFACDNNLTSVPNVTTGVDKKQAVNSITASNEINSGAGAIYHAGNTVKFTPPFHAKSGAKLHGYIAGCTGTFLARQVTDTAVELDENHIEFTAKEAKKSPISISPNPTTGILKIASEDLNDGTHQITDLFGTTIFKSDFKNQKEIEVNIQNQPKGVYIVKIITANQTYTHKIIKN